MPVSDSQHNPAAEQASINNTHDSENDPRLELIRQWLESDCELRNFAIEVASADASFRRYFRVRLNNSQPQSYIVMDAPPDKEDCAPFIHIARLLEQGGVHAPHIYQYDAAQGFMLLSDLGNRAYLDQLNPDTVDTLYGDAISAIIHMQQINAELPAYDETLLRTEMSLFSDWYLARHLQLELKPAQQRVLDTTLKLLVDNALQQPQVFVHRDYHSRNLMITEENNPGVIDFQDAVVGAASYDLVSLIKDCYIAWPRHKQLQWIRQYLAQTTLQTETDAFIKQLDLMGLQRHIKVCGIFSRLNYRDGKPGYLADIPRTLAYVFDVCQRYDELSDFAALLAELDIHPDADLLEQLQ
jgi:aminoglycoside/choline kinase family phosphotransferase